MRIGQVIGKAVMSKQDPAFGGARWLVVSPVATEHLNSACQTPPPVSDQPSLIVYDQLGAGLHDIVGFVEGAEATAPFENPTPIDAITVALFDQIHHVPFKN